MFLCLAQQRNFCGNILKYDTTSFFRFRRSNLLSKDNTHNYASYLTIPYQILRLNTGDSNETIFVFTTPKIICSQGVKFFSIWLLARHLHRTENT